jgi:hypothetical protein
VIRSILTVFRIYFEAGNKKESQKAFGVSRAVDCNSVNIHQTPLAVYDMIATRLLVISVNCCVLRSSSEVSGT